MAFHLRRQQRDLDLSTLTPILAGRKKRQLSQMSSPASSRASSPHGKMSRKIRRSERPLARIEMLPAELLAQIFSYTCNMALPQASLELGEKLSNEAIYRAYFLRLFWQVDRYKKDNLCVGDYCGRADTKPPCVVDPLVETQSYKTRVLLCRWMTKDRFERYRNDILTAVKDVPDTESVELFMGTNDDHGTTGPLLSPPTALLRYRPLSGSGSPDRGSELFRVLLKYYLIQLDPLGDGDERVRDMFQQALLKDDYQLVYLIVRNDLCRISWISEIRLALEHTENPAKMWNFVYLIFGQSKFIRLYHRPRSSFSLTSFTSDLRGLRESMEDDFPGFSDPVSCFSADTADELRHVVTKGEDSFWKEQAELVTTRIAYRVPGL